MAKNNTHLFEYRIVSEEADETSFDWSKILGLLCGEICFVTMTKENQNKYIEDDEYRSKVINFIRAKTSLSRRENIYSLCISLDRKDINDL